MNTQYVLSLSYGKDSLACLEAVKQLGLPLDRIIHAEVWATPTIPADLPPMVEFKKKADKIIKERYGITVEHITATKPNGGGTTPLKVNFTLQEKIRFLAEPYMASLVLSIRGAIANLKSMRCQKLTYEDIFYRQVKTRSGGGTKIYGFPMLRGQWCNSALKMSAIAKLRASPRDGVNTARENSNAPHLRIPGICQTGKLVYPTQNESFQKARTLRAV